LPGGTVRYKRASRTVRQKKKGLPFNVHNGDGRSDKEDEVAYGRETLRDVKKAGNYKCSRGGEDGAAHSLGRQKKTLDRISSHGTYKTRGL